MTSFPFRLEVLGEDHERVLFTCGEEALDRYFQTQVTQDIRRRVANCLWLLKPPPVMLLPITRCRRRVFH